MYPKVESAIPTKNPGALDKMFFFFFFFFNVYKLVNTQCLLLQPSGSLSVDTKVKSKINHFQEQSNEMVYILVKHDAFL